MIPIRVLSAICSALIALAAVVGMSTASFADSGAVTLTIYKAGGSSAAPVVTAPSTFRENITHFRPAVLITASSSADPEPCTTEG
jgi:hypothetical protein